jgi:hypothetical protein
MPVPGTEPAAEDFSGLEAKAVVGPYAMGAGKETGLVIRPGKKSDDQRLSGAESESFIARSNVLPELFDEVRTDLSFGRHTPE